MKAIALTCGRCGGNLLVSPGVAFGVCNPCSAGWILSTEGKRGIPVEEPILEGEAAAEVIRLPFVRFDAAGGGAEARIYVMAFGLAKIGSPHDDGSKLTVGGFEGEMRPGRLDRPVDLPIQTAAGLARFLGLRRLDPDGKARLRPAAIRLSAPAIVAIPFRVKGGSLVDPITGIVLERSLAG